LNQKLNMTKEVKLPYEEGEHFEAISGAPCPNCDAEWYKDAMSGEGFYCGSIDQWGNEYEAVCGNCGYWAEIQLKAIVIKQGLTEDCGTCGKAKQQLTLQEIELGKCSTCQESDEQD
jgi:hypothetical protein